jgi:hypothetical protein
MTRSSGFRTAPGGLGAPWTNPGQTLDMSWYHRPLSNPGFRSTTLIRLASPAAASAAFYPRRRCLAHGIPVVSRCVPQVVHLTCFGCGTCGPMSLLNGSDAFQKETRRSILCTSPSFVDRRLRRLPTRDGMNPSRSHQGFLPSAVWKARQSFQKEVHWEGVIPPPMVAPNIGPDQKFVCVPPATFIASKAMLLLGRMDTGSFSE